MDASFLIDGNFLFGVDLKESQTGSQSDMDVLACFGLKGSQREATHLGEKMRRYVQ